MAQPITQLIPAVIRELPVHRPIESGQPRTSEERQFELAIHEPKIFQQPLEVLKSALRYVFVLTGLRGQDIPVEEEKQMLLEYIWENYGGHTAEEIKFAFKLAIQYKLPIDHKKVPHYGNFSPAYFTEIMEAYRAWALDKNDIIAEKSKPVEKPLTLKQKADIEIEYALFLLNKIDKLPIKIGTSRRNS